jgi:CubicO group peptidase (beta-lactamase class C family)
MEPTMPSGRAFPKGPTAGRGPGQPWWSGQIDALFAPWSAQHGMPGAAVLVVHHRAVIHRANYGLADITRGVRINPKTSFLLASLTKQFTAMAVMMLVERGGLSYENRVSEFFPDFPAVARDITVQHLLQHTAGFREYSDLFIMENKISAPDDVRDPWPRSASLPPSAYEPTSEDTRRILTRHELTFVPGERWSYSNSGYVVLGRIVEVVSGRSYPNFLKRRIFEPIGMANSVVPVRGWRRVPNRATSYSWAAKYQDIDYTPLNLTYGEDGVYTTIDDMFRWDQALYTAALVKQSTLDEAFRSGKLNNGDPIDYGYGWFIGKDFVDHEGAWLGFRTYIRRYRSRRLTVIILANCAQLNAAAMGNDIADIVCRI